MATTRPNALTREVPSFSETTFADRHSNYAICVFVLNEGERFRSQLRAMQLYALAVDIVVVDGGSTDGSLDDEFLASCGVSALLVKTGSGALSAQMRVGLHWCLERGYEGVLTVDGNGKDDVSAIPDFVTALRNGADHVQGSRYVPGGRGVNTPLSRHLGVTLLHAPLISMAARVRYTDTTNGFRAYSRKFLLDPRVNPFRRVFVAYELHYYLAIRAGRLGFNVREIPVTRSYPSAGGVPSKIKGLRGNARVLKTLLRAVMGAYNPKA